MEPGGDGEAKALVLDCGSGTVKAGLAGSDAPSAVFSTLVGRPRHRQAMVGCAFKDAYIGAEAQRARGVLHLTSPIERGVVTDWPDMERILHHTLYNELRVAPEEHPLLLTEAPLNPRLNRETMAQLMFEYFQVPALYIAIQAVLALFASNSLTGVVVDCGDGVTHTVPVYEGYALDYGIRRSNLGGRDATALLARLLLGRGRSFTSSSELEIVHDMKEQLGYVAADCGAELAQSERLAEYKLPDGQVVSLGAERFQAAELLFQPALAGQSARGVHALAYDCITACAIDLRREFYGNVILSGGGSMFPGLQQRLERELDAVASCSPAEAARLLEGGGGSAAAAVAAARGSSLDRPAGSTFAVKVAALPARMFSAWAGGSLLSSLSSFQQQWVTQADYVEHGPGIVHKKCF